MITEKTPDQLFAHKRSSETNPYQSGNYYGDVSQQDWLDQSIFTLWAYCPNIADVLDDSNYACIIKELESLDLPEFWASEYVSSWLSRIERITIYPFGRDNDQPFNSDIVATCQDILYQLDDYPIMDGEHYSNLEYEQFSDSLAFELRDYDDNDPIRAIVQNAFDYSSGEYDAFLYDDLPDIIETYEDQQAL